MQNICVTCKVKALKCLMDLFRSRKRKKEKGRFLEQSLVEHLFELPEYLRYDHGLRKIVSCFLGVMQTIHLQFPLHYYGLVFEGVCYGQQVQGFLAIWVLLIEKFNLTPNWKKDLAVTCF